MEIRDNSLHVDGYVNAVCRDSKPIYDFFMGDFFIEQISEGAFADSLGRNSDVKMLFNHDETRELAENGQNMQLYEDAIGLRVHAEISDPEVVEAAKEGYITGWSFGFTNPVSTWEETKPFARRYINKLDLLEVSILTVEPAYYATTAEFRTADGSSKAREIRNATEKFEMNEEKAASQHSDVGKVEEETKSVPDYSALQKKIEILSKF